MQAHEKGRRHIYVTVWLAQPSQRADGSEGIQYVFKDLLTDHEIEWPRHIAWRSAKIEARKVELGALSPRQVYPVGSADFHDMQCGRIQGFEDPLGVGGARSHCGSPLEGSPSRVIAPARSGAGSSGSTHPTTARRSLVRMRFSTVRSLRRSVPAQLQSVDPSHRRRIRGLGRSRRLSAMGQSSVSVVICTRNRCASLARALASIAADPSTTPTEVIVADNASTDRTGIV
jgi:hypothetical protein